MNTGNNNATNNFVIRLWSETHKPKNERTPRDQARIASGYSGTITEVKSKEERKFHTAGGLLKALEDLNKNAERVRREERR